MIAKNKRPYTEGEDIIKPIIYQVTNFLSADDKSINRRIMEIPMSDNTMARRTQEIFDDIQIQTAQIVINSRFGLFSLQLDETIDCGDLSQLCVFIRCSRR